MSRTALLAAAGLVATLAGIAGLRAARPGVGHRPQERPVPAKKRGQPELTAPSRWVTVFLGSEANHSVRLPEEQIGRPLDLAYDPRSRQLLALLRREGAWRVEQFTTTGERLAGWSLSGNLAPSSWLVARGDEIELAMWDSRLHEEVLVKLQLDREHSVRTVPVPGGYAGYEHSLDQVAEERVRRLMIKLHWSPPTREWCGDTEPLVRQFAVNMPRPEARIAWIRRTQVLCYGWDVPAASLKVAFSGNGRKPVARDLFPSVEKALHVKDGPYTQVWLTSIAVTEGWVACGVEVRRPTGAAAKVCWVRLRSSRFGSARAASGRLARILACY
jgi:hypothetical protein